MIIYLSPAKTMKETVMDCSSLLFDNSEIVNNLRSMTKAELKKMYRCSDKIVETVAYHLENPVNRYTYAGDRKSVV